MTALNRHTLKLIYCYLICLITVIYVMFKVASLTSDLFKVIYFDPIVNLSYELKAESFANRDHHKKMKPEQVEVLRQQAIAVYAKEEPVRMKHRIIFDLPYLFYAIISLLIHAFIIFKAKESTKTKA